MTFPDPELAGFESLAASCLSKRLRERGPPPWSICEAGCGEDEYATLHKWAQTVRLHRLHVTGWEAGFVLITLFSEWNRRNSTGGEIWPGLSLLFNDDVRHHLFTASGDARQCLRDLLRDTFTRCRLRNTFSDSVVTDHWYVSLQLQYGFSLPHAKDHLANWMRGHQLPYSLTFLLEPEGQYRSASFQRLIRGLKSFRRSYLPDTELRRLLKATPWVLPAWTDALVEAIATVAPTEIDDAAALTYDPLGAPSVLWEDGPTVVCAVNPLPQSDEFNEPRYVLRNKDRVIARFYRLANGSYETDVPTAHIAISSPTVLATLEEDTDKRDVICVQEIRLWDPNKFVQVRAVGRSSYDAGEYLVEGRQVLITPELASIAPEPDDWRLVSTSDRRWRWSLLDQRRATTVKLESISWAGEPPSPPPAWANEVAVSIEPACGAVRLYDKIRFLLQTPPDVVVDYVVCGGRGLAFEDPTRLRSCPVPVTADMANACRVIVGVTRQGVSTAVHMTVGVPLRAVTLAADGRELPRRLPVLCCEVAHSPVLIASDGPAVLMEGRCLALRDGLRQELPVGKATRLHGLLGTGQPVILADSEFNTHISFDIAASAQDTGIIKAVDAGRQTLCISLLISRPPRAGDLVLLWSPHHGLEWVKPSSIRHSANGSAWSIALPWQTETCLASIAYCGHWQGTGLFGVMRDFFNPEAEDALTIENRLSLLRWCRLPALRADPESLRNPLIGRLAAHATEMAHTATRDVVTLHGETFVCEPSESARASLFDVVLRETYFRPHGYLTPDVCRSIVDMQPQEAFDALLSNAPVMACYALNVVARQRRSENAQYAKAWLKGFRVNLLALSPNATEGEIARRLESLLVTRTRIEGVDEIRREIPGAGILTGILTAIENHVFQQQPITGVYKANLHTLLGIASFRTYIAAHLLRLMINEQP